MVVMVVVELGPHRSEASDVGGDEITDRQHVMDNDIANCKVKCRACRTYSRTTANERLLSFFCRLGSLILCMYGAVQAQNPNVPLVLKLVMNR